VLRTFSYFWLRFRPRTFSDQEPILYRYQRSYHNLKVAINNLTFVGLTVTVPIQLQISPVLVPVPKTPLKNNFFHFMFYFWAGSVSIWAHVDRTANQYCAPVLRTRSRSFFIGAGAGTIWNGSGTSAKTYFFYFLPWTINLLYQRCRPFFFRLRTTGQEPVHFW